MDEIEYPLWRYGSWFAIMIWAWSDIDNTSPTLQGIGISEQD